MVMKQLKGMIGMTVLVPVAGAAMGAVGNLGAGMSAGMKGATQSLMSVGVVSHASKMFKW